MSLLCLLTPFVSPIEPETVEKEPKKETEKPKQVEETEKEEDEKGKRGQKEKGVRYLFSNQKSCYCPVMARIPRNPADNTVYHILNRANGRETIFKKEKDYETFLDLLLEAKERYPMRILSFCIMPNHWHFVLYPEKSEDLPRFMRFLTHTHTQRYHAHYKTIGYGHLYQGRYKSFPVERDDHFLQLCRYIERNPLRAGLVGKADSWKWSSLFIRRERNSKWKLILSKWPVERTAQYLSWVNTLQKEEEEKLEVIRYSIKKGKPFGSDSWVQRTAKEFNLLTTLRGRGRPRKEKGT